MCRPAFGQADRLRPEFVITDPSFPAAAVRRTYHLLDALRGIAAIIVVQRHTIPLLGDRQFRGSFLAVDLFFALSGFVIAYAYERRLRDGLSKRQFMMQRVIRLYPLYLIGLLLGLIEAVLAVRDGTLAGVSSDVATGLALGLLLVPAWIGIELNGPRWSLFYELLVNAAYAAISRYLSTPRLLAVIAAAAFGLVMATARGTPIDSGWRIEDLGIASARVGFSFFTGVLLYRLHTGAAARGMAIVLIVIITLALAGATAWVSNWTTLVGLIIIFTCFPAMIAVAVRWDVHGRVASVSAFLGILSYAVYVLHQPSGLLFRARARKPAERYRHRSAI